MTWHPDIPHEYRNAIVTGDARVLAERIPDKSVDMIFCDPVFYEVDQYFWVASLAKRILKEGGNLICESGHLYLPEIIPGMMATGLTWQSILAEVYPRADHRIAKSKTLIGWSPYLWLSKGDRSGPWVFDRYHSNGSNKQWHKWGDHPAFATVYIYYLTEIGGIVVDPFTGGGTVPAVCKMLNRNYIAFEIDPDTAELARERVRNTQPPLPLKYHEQLELLPGD